MFNNRSANKKLSKTYINFIQTEKTIFIHIPKNSGTSIATAFGLENSSHITVTEVNKLIGKCNFNKAFKFAVIRDPLSRFISLYKYARMDESYYHSALNPEKAPFGKHLDYDLLQDASLEDCANYLLDGKLRHDKNWNHWNPQSFWINDFKGRLIIDFLLRYENLSNDFKQLKDKIGLTNAVLPGLNKSRKRLEKEIVITDKVREIVYQYYMADYQLLQHIGNL